MRHERAASPLLARRHRRGSYAKLARVGLRQIKVDQAEARKRFFLKKAAKTLASWPIRQPPNNPLRTKVFWFFFSKKNRFLP
jgi:hypothetical protein